MTALRTIPLPGRPALELTLGLVVTGVPFALGLGIAAAVVGIVAGALLVGRPLGAAVAGADQSFPQRSHS